MNYTLEEARLQYAIAIREYLKRQGEFQKAKLRHDHAKSRVQALSDEVKRLEADHPDAAAELWTP